MSAGAVSRRTLLRSAAVIGGTAGLATASGLLTGAATARATTAVPPLATNDVGSIGDSISHNGVGRGVTGETGNGMAVFGVESFIGWALLQCSGRYRYHGTWATGGFTTRHIRYNHLPSALHSGAAIISLVGGTNDIRQHVPLADTQAYLDYMVTALLANRQLPILGTIPPYDPGTALQQAQVIDFNSWITGYAASKGVPLVDYHSLLVDTSTGRYRPDCTIDGIHPSSTGAYLMGGALAEALDGLPGGVAPALLTGYSTSALLHDATILGPPAGQTATWLVSGSTADNGGLTPTPGPGWAGNMGICRRGAGDYYMLGTVSPLTSGHTVSMSFILDTGQIPVGGVWTIVLRDSTTHRIICGYSNMNQSISPGISSWQFPVPHGLNPHHNIQLVYGAQAEPGTTLGLAQVTIRDLTP